MTNTYRSNKVITYCNRILQLAVAVAISILLSGCATYLLLDDQDSEERLGKVLEIHHVQDGYLVKYRAVETIPYRYKPLSEAERFAFVSSLSDIEKNYDYIYGDEACNRVRAATGRPEMACSEAPATMVRLNQPASLIDTEGLRVSPAADGQCIAPCFVPFEYSDISGFWLIPAEDTFPTAYRIYPKRHLYSSSGLITKKVLALPLAVAFDLATSPLQLAGYLWLEYGDWHFGF